MADDAEIDLANVFADIARALLAEPDARTTLDRIVRLAVATIDGCQHCGVSVVEGSKVVSPASSDEVPAIVDALQSETGEGPSVDAIRRHAVFQTGRLSEEHRWPRFAGQAKSASGIESILSFRLFAGTHTMGALNLYSTERDAFDDHDVALGAVFAAHAAAAWSASRTIDHLRAGMESRSMIGTAVGILMARQDISEEEAFEVLTRASQRLNVKLRLLAEQIVHPEDHRPASLGPEAASELS